MVEKTDKWVMLLIGLVGGWVISTAPGWLQASSHEHWWDIATAVGTVSTVVWAVFATHSADRRAIAANDRYVSTFILVNKRTWEDSCRKLTMFINALQTVSSNPQKNTIPVGLFTAAIEPIQTMILSNEVIAGIGERSVDKGTLLAEISTNADKLKQFFSVLVMLGHGSPAFIDFANKNLNEAREDFERLKGNLTDVCEPHRFAGE